MAAVKPLIGFGLAIIGAGFMWKLYEDTINSFIGKYILDINDKYFLMSDLVWNALPFLIIFLGIVCLIYGGVSGTSSQKNGGEN